MFGVRVNAYFLIHVFDINFVFRTNLMGTVKSSVMREVANALSSTAAPASVDPVREMSAMNREIYRRTYEDQPLGHSDG